MTFDAYEASAETSRPIELYEVVLGSQKYLITSAEDDQVVDLLTYTATAVKRGSISSTSERGVTLPIEVPADHALPSQYIESVPGRRARLVVKRVQRLDFPSPEVVRLFDGYITSVNYRKNGQIAEIVAQPILSSLSQIVPRFSYQAQCAYNLYEDGCDVDDTSSSYRLTGTVSAVNGNVISVVGADGYSSGWFDAGSIERLGGIDARMILSHTTTDLTVLFPFPENIVGESVVVLAGCAHTPSVCHTKFSNLINIAAWAYVPKKNVFETGLD